jgi:hypothetical protein
MAGQAPKARFSPFPCDGVLTEFVTPSRLANGLTACQNLIYERQGSWGKRPGADQSILPLGDSITPASGFRWYASYPSPVTKLVVYEQGHLFIGNDQFSLHDQGAFPLSGDTAPMFCSARDPQGNAGNGEDILIITGITIDDGSFAQGNITITGQPGAQPMNSYIEVSFKLGAGPTVWTSQYMILGSDNAASIASELTDLINETTAFLAGGSAAPFIGEAYYTVPPPRQSMGNPPQPIALVHFGARHGGAGGNSITFKVVFNDNTDSNSTLGVFLGNGVTEIGLGRAGPWPESAILNFAGGGEYFAGPCRYGLGVDEGIVEGLSYMAPNAFTGCTTWHDHCWFWGDPNNPDYLFASDIFQPECFTFMEENGGMSPSPGQGTQPGGYAIGVGDGDPGVVTCVPSANGLYVLKYGNIYIVEGYDFQQGEYAFSVTPQVQGYGTTSLWGATVLENELIFWSGKKFMRLAPGSYEPEHIGMPVPLTEAMAAAGLQSAIRVVAGSFQVQTLLQNYYGAPLPFESDTILLRSVALFAFDDGSGEGRLIAVYDDEKTALSGQYAWSIWTGWRIGAWIPYGQGPTPLGIDVDKPILLFINPDGTTISQMGAHAADDWENPIPWMAQTGWIDFGDPEVLKNVHRLFLSVEAVPGAEFTATLIPNAIIEPAMSWPSPYPTTPQMIEFNPTVAPNGGEAHNELVQYVEQSLQGTAAMLQLSEAGGSGPDWTAFELVRFGFDQNPAEAFAP